jgi:pyrroline-5-carboxylate reductase
MADILIIGAGNMGLAFGKGLLRNPVHKVYFKMRQGTVTDTDNFITENNQHRVFFNDDYQFFDSLNTPWIILAVKPHLIETVIQESAELFKKISPKALISLAAGIDIATIQQAQSSVELNIPIIRTMPNIPVATGNGIVGFYSHNPELYDDFKALCSGLGLLSQLATEDNFHIFTALAGSGPAYIFHMIEALAIGAEYNGMDKRQAEQIACQTFIGAATLLNQDSPSNLRKKVTSPNGTTQAGLEQLMNLKLDPDTSHLTHLISNTLKAAKKRSENMR